jgi:hypothetical protein
MEGRLGQTWSPEDMMPSAPAVRRVAIALACSAVLSAVFATRVVTSFAPQRLKVVTEALPASAGSVTVSLPGRDEEPFHQPLAVIARIANSSPRARTYSFTLDGRRFCTREVGPGEHRIDCALAEGLQPGPGHTIGIGSDVERDVSWNLQYLEVATHHGATRAYDLIVVPRLLTAYDRPGAGGIVAVFLVFATLLSLPAARASRRAGVAYRAAAGLVVAFLSLVVLSPLVSRFLVLVSARWFFVAGLLVVAPRLRYLWTWIGIHAGHRTRRRVAVPLAIFSFVLLPYGAVVSRLLDTRYGGNYSGFIQISRNLFDRNPLVNGRDEVRERVILSPGGGYDGQFVYFAAFDPLVTRFRHNPAAYSEFIDAPPYRLARIGLSWTAVLLSGGHWQYFPAVMMWAILGALAGLSAGLTMLRPGGERNPLIGSLVLLVPSFWQSVQLCLPEPLAAVFIVAGFAALFRNRPGLAGLLCGLSLFFRETGGIFVVLMLADSVVKGRTSSAVRFGVFALLPYLAWRVYLGSVLSPAWGIHAYWMNVNNLGVPFQGLLELLGRVWRGVYYPTDASVGRAAVWFSALLVVALATSIFAAIRLKSVAAIAASVYGLIAVSLTFDSIWIHVGNGQRGSYELFVSLAVLTATTAKEERAVRWALWCVWLVAAAYVLYGGFDSGLIRATII